MNTCKTCKYWMPWQYRYQNPVDGVCEKIKEGMNSNSYEVRDEDCEYTGQVMEIETYSNFGCTLYEKYETD